MRSLFHAQSIRWVTAAITFSVAGVGLLFGPSHLEYPAPFYVMHLAGVIDSFILAATFYASIGLIIGKRVAWRVALLILALSTVWESLEVRSNISMLSVFSFVALVVVWRAGRYYQLKSESDGVSRGLQRALLFAIISTFIGCIGFFLLATIERHHFHLLPSIIESLDRMYSPQDIFEPLRNVAASHIAGRILLFLLGVGNYMLIALALLKPLTDKFYLTPALHNKVLTLIRKYSTSSEDYFKYFPNDKSYFFSTTVDGCIAYSVRRGTCVALADPIAPTAEDQHVIVKEFQRFCSKHGWQLAFVAVSDQSKPIYTANGLRLVKIGENAIVDLAAYTAASPSKKTRYFMNRFTKASYSAGFEEPRHSQKLMRELQEISDDWLSHRGRKEHQFAMGYFAPDYIQKSRLFVVRDEHQTIIAYVTLQPNFSDSGQASIDLMRTRAVLPASTMDFLFIQLINQLHAEGWKTLDMGLAPLSGLEQAEQINERGLHILYRYTNRWLTFRGLRHFKDKFNPTWESRFLAYSGPSTRLPIIALAVNDLMKYTSK